MFNRSPDREVQGDGHDEAHSAEEATPENNREKRDYRWDMDGLTHD